jgi:hypothetical protein
VEASEMLSRMLKKEGIVHSVLNAKYHEQEAEIVARAGQKGELEIPKEFTLLLPVYEGFKATTIRVLLRYRINDGVLSFICKPVNIERTLIAIREAVIDQINTETHLPVYMGNASSVPSRKVQ